MSARIACIVPHCRRTVSADKYPGCEIICAKHWRLISRRTRASKARAERRHRKLVRLWERANGRRDAHASARLARIIHRSNSACGRAWTRCRVEAIEAAVGIA